MNLVLVKLSNEYKKLLFEMMDEWLGKEAKEEIVPGSIVRNDYHDFEYYLEHLDIKYDTDKLVSDSTYFALDKDRNIFVGAINIRHSLNEYLLKIGGHIGDGIRPSERGKGYATEMIRLALIKCKDMGIRDVLMTCNKENIASRKTIIKNGGIKENEIIIENEIVERYWIRL